MAFGISFIDIDLLIRLAQNQNAESRTDLLAPEAEILAAAFIAAAPVASLTSDSFSAQNSATNIAATLTETPAPVLPVDLKLEKPAENPSAKNDKAAEIVFKPAAITTTSIAQKPKPDAQNELDAELIFRNLLERFRAAVTYDYEISDAVKLEEDAERIQKPFGKTNENRIEAQRRKLLQDRENYKQEALRKAAIDAENNNADGKKRELRKKIEEANKFL
jgi:hypothetical protein